MKIKHSIVRKAARCPRTWTCLKDRFVGNLRQFARQSKKKSRGDSRPQPNWDQSQVRFCSTLSPVRDADGPMRLSAYVQAYISLYISPARIDSTLEKIVETKLVSLDFGRKCTYFEEKQCAHNMLLRSQETNKTKVIICMMCLINSS